MRVVAVIPALNESATIANVITSVRAVVDAVYVVDDGSTDGTRSLAEGAGAVVIRHERPSGYDAAVACGINHAFEDGAAVVVTCDADGQHRATDVLAVSSVVLHGEADFAAGMRDVYNRRVEFIMGLIAREVFGTRDPFCGLKCYGRRVYELKGPFPADMHIGTLPLVWAKRLRLRTRFVEIAVARREDQPRFGKRLRADFKLLRAFAATLRSATKPI